MATKISELTVSRRKVNANWKEDIFSLPEVCNYIRRKNANTEKEKEIVNFFSHVKNVKREAVNPEFIRLNCPADHLGKDSAGKLEIKKLVRDQKTKKFYVSEVRREKFSLWYVEACILNAAAKIQAAAGVQKETKKPEKTILEETAAAEKKAAAAVNANKRRNQAAAAGKKSAAA